MISGLEGFWDIMPALLGIAVPIVALTGAFIAAGARHVAKMQSEENLHRVRMAAIERGIYPTGMHQTSETH